MPARPVQLSLIALALAACGSSDAPQLAFREVRSWSVPPDGPSIPAPRSVARGLPGEWIVLDTAGRVLVYGDDGAVRRRWSMPESSVGNPEGACRLLDGRIAVADTHYHRVVLFDGEGRVAGMFGERGSGPGQFEYPVALTIDAAGRLYVAEYGGNDRIQVFDPAGSLLRSFGGFGSGPGQFQRPSGVVWDAGIVYVSDAMGGRVLAFRDSGAFLGVLGGDAPPALHLPYDLTQAADGTLWLAEYGAGRVTQLDTAGRVLGRWGRTGHGPAELRTPWGLAIGPDGRVVVADTGNRRLLELVP